MISDRGKSLPDLSSIIYTTASNVPISKITKTNWLRRIGDRTFIVILKRYGMLSGKFQWAGIPVPLESKSNLALVCEKKHLVITTYFHLEKSALYRVIPNVAQKSG